MKGEKKGRAEENRERGGGKKMKREKKQRHTGEMGRKRELGERRRR